MHSVTKYIGGHSDVVMGVTATRSTDLDQRLRFIQNGAPATRPPARVAHATRPQQAWARCPLPSIATWRCAA